MPKRDPILWRSTPPRTRIIFLAAVFCVFAGIGFANDVIDMGSWPPLRFALSVLLMGVCAIGYAAGGIILRNKFWKVLIPLIIVQFIANGLLATRFPNGKAPGAYDVVATAHLQARMAFDGIAVIIAAILGYVGFVNISISEARRYAKTQREKATLDAEMTAAREIQRVMVPENLPPVSGYAIESAYRPAAEVGGDFFQVIELKSGSTLVVIGDVSGKGLRAAMIVSMLVGMLRTLARYQNEPAEILNELNRHESGRAENGFATCLIIRLDDGGNLAVANAGHIPPYLNGTEIASAGSLPLGLVTTADYAQSNLRIGVGDRLVLLTDGVPEALDGNGDLFGFPRVESQLKDGADVAAVATAAQSYGQSDDITVISIARRA